MPQKGKNILVSWPKHFGRTRQQKHTQILPLQQKPVCAPPKRARQGPSLPLFVFLLSGLNCFYPTNSLTRFQPNNTASQRLIVNRLSAFTDSTITGKNLISARDYRTF
jgi:hypothetical protein